jgi:hypothetical protein
VVGPHIMKVNAAPFVVDVGARFELETRDIVYQFRSHSFMRF